MPYQADSWKTEEQKPAVDSGSASSGARRTTPARPTNSSWPGTAGPASAPTAPGRGALTEPDRLDFIKHDKHTTNKHRITTKRYIHASPEHVSCLDPAPAPRPIESLLNLLGVSSWSWLTRATHRKFRLFICFFVTLCGPAVSSTGAHGFVM